MEKNLKSFFSLFIVGSILLFLFIFLIRYIIDPVGLNNKFNIGLPKDIGNFFRTQKFVEINNVKPNTIIIGGSRVHYMQTEHVQKYTNDIVYNLGFSYSTLEEQYYFLKYSLENFDIKNVLIGLNLYTFSNKIQEHYSDFDKNIFTNGFTLFDKFKHYLNLDIISYLKYVVNNPNLEEPYYNNGAITYYNQNHTLKTDIQKRLHWSYLGYKKTYSNYLNLNPNIQNKNFEYFKKMIELCNQYKNKVNCKVFTTSIHNKQLNILKEVNKTNEYYYWKKEVSKITPYWDFMYNNDLSKIDDNFIDTSHLKIDFVKLYLNKLFNDNSNKELNNLDFGLYVDQSNVDQHIELLKSKNGF